MRFAAIARHVGRSEVSEAIGPYKFVVVVIVAVSWPWSVVMVIVVHTAMSRPWMISHEAGTFRVVFATDNIGVSWLEMSRAG